MRFPKRRHRSLDDPQLLIEISGRRIWSNAPREMEFFTSELAVLSKTREDILTWADLLDLDDYVSYGGTP